MEIKTFTLTLGFLATLLDAAIAQGLYVKSLAEAPHAIIAVEDEKKDLAGRPCGLVKVQLPVEGAVFDGCVTTVNKIGEYWVYMEDGSYMLTVKHANFHPLSINFRDHGIERIEGKRTYILSLLLPESKEKTNIETFTVNGVSFNMVRVEGGTFMMGATPEQENDAYYGETPVHQVTLSTYSIGETEVTQALWQAVMGSNPSHFKGSNRPVEMVSWKDCQKFIKKLNKLTNRSFRLPTEAEWEYAARGGKKSQGYKYAGSNMIDNVAWYAVNSYDKGNNSPFYGPQDVGGKAPNELGLYDMSGNVKEWCYDWYDTYRSSAQMNPTGPSSDICRVIRGGSWYRVARSCRVSARLYSGPGYRGYYNGLRLAL